MGRRTAIVVTVIACGARTELDVVDADDASNTSVRDTDVPDAASEEVSPGTCDSTHIVLEQYWSPTNGGWIEQLVVDGPGIYFATATGVWLTSTAGATPTLVGPSVTDSEFASFAVDSQNVVWVDGDFPEASHVMRAPKDGGTPSLLANISEGLFTSVALADGGVYVWQYPNGNQHIGTGLVDIEFVTDQGVATFAGSFMSYTAKVVVADSTIYVGGGEGIFAWNAPLLVSLSSIPVQDFALDEGAIVFTELVGPQSGPLSVWRVAIDGGSAVPLAKWYSTDLGGIVVDESAIYFCDTAAGTIVRIDKISNELSVIASDPQSPQSSPIDLALDGTCIYWTAVNYHPPGLNHIYVSPK